MPDAKIIYLLRDPVERAWSSAAMSTENEWSRSIDGSTESEALEILTRPAAEAHSSYQQTLKVWEDAYPPEQIYIAFFDDVRDRPQFVWSEICAFLGVDADQAHVPAGIGDKVNQRTYSEAPAEIQRALSSRFLPTLEFLDARFDNAHTERWLASAQLAIDAPS